MANTLNQFEVDNLLESLQHEKSEREAWERSVRSYDFLNPDRLTRNSRKALENIHEDFAKIFATHLSNTLRANVQLQMVSLDQLSIAEFMESINTPTCLYQFSLNPLERAAVIEIHSSLAFYMVDRILGGPGTGNHLMRELTDIEQNIMNRLVHDGLARLKSSWQRMASFEVGPTSYFSSPNYLQFAKSGESVISAVFEVEIEKSQNMFMITYPYYLIDRMLPTNEQVAGQGSAVASPVEKDIIQRNLEATKTPVSVMLGQTRLSIGELVNLQSGDVVLLNRQTSDPLELMVGRQTRFWGKAGVVKNRLAFKVSERNEIS